MADGCPIIVGDPTLAMIQTQYGRYSDFAMAAYTLSTQQLADLGGYKFDPIKFDIGFDAQGTAYYIAPTKPALPDTRYSAPAIVPAPPGTGIAINLDSIGPVPIDTTQAPYLNEPTAPTMALPQAPGPAPSLTPISIPAAPDIAIPDFPELRDIVLPDPVTVTLPVFQGVRPTFTAVPPAETFAFTPQEYTSALLDKTRARVSGMLDGGTGLPAAVIAALRARAYTAADLEESRSVQQAVEEFASRGFSEPNGILSRRVAEVRQNSQNQRNALSRDIYINDEQIAVENLRFAVTQGVALEGSLINAHIELMRISLDGLRTAAQIKIDLFNVQVALFNAQQQAYQTDAQVQRDLIQAELAKVEVYRAELEGKRLIGELNQQDVQIYAERVRALVSMAEMYRFKVEAVQAQAQVNTQIIEGYRATVSAFGENVRAYEAQWGGFRAQVDANVAKARVFEISENAYATRVQAWRTKSEQTLALGNFQIAQRDLELRGWRGKLDLHIAELQAERDRVTAAVQAYTGGVELYRADASIAQVASESQQRTLQLNIERERARVDTALKQAQLDIEQLEKLTALIIEKKKSIAQVAAQLAASSMSAVSFHAGASTSVSQGQSCSTSFSFSE